MLQNHLKLPFKISQLNFEWPYTKKLYIAYYVTRKIYIHASDLKTSNVGLNFFLPGQIISALSIFKRTITGTVLRYCNINPQFFFAQFMPSALLL